MTNEGPLPISISDSLDGLLMLDIHPALGDRCWFLCTQGLQELGQTEICFCIRAEPGETMAPSTALELAELIRNAVVKMSQAYFTLRLLVSRVCLNRGLAY